MKNIITDEAIIKVQSLLKKMNDEAYLQRAKYREIHESVTRRVVRSDGVFIEINGVLLPEALAMAKISTDPNYFIFFLLETYWGLSALVGENIKDPLIQFSMRALVELCYGKILFFYLQKPEKQINIVIKYWLCMEGLQMASRKNNNTGMGMYQHLLDMLPTNSSNKNRFIKIKNNKFSLVEISSELQTIFPSVRIKEMKDQLEDYLVEIWGATYDRNYLEMIYIWLSQYAHGNILLVRNMNNENVTRRHVFKCSLILFLTGYHLLNFTHKEILENSFDNNNLLEIKDEIKLITKELKDF